MRRIVHISDLHFGTTEQKLVDALVRDIEERAPHLVVVTGDLTQRARNREFDAAEEFLKRLPQPQRLGARRAGSNGARRGAIDIPFGSE